MKKSFILIFSLIFISNPAYSKNRIISLMPALTQIVYSLGASEQIVGVDSFSAQSAKGKEIVGNVNFLNKEKILTLKPNIILATVQHRYIVEDLRVLGVKIYYFDSKNIEEIHSNIIKIGNITNKKENARALVSKVCLLENQYKTKKPKKILYVIQANPLIVAAKDNYIDSLIKKSGNINAVENLKGDYVSVTSEYLFQIRPDVIVVQDEYSKKYLKMFLKSKIVVLDSNQLNIINRPDSKTYLALKFFCGL